MIGNGLRELDRFLSVLLDEVVLAAGWGDADLRMFGRLRNTANKWEAISVRLGLPTHDLARLRALGRCRGSLFYCDGVVRRGDTRQGRTLTLGWPTDGEDSGADVVLTLGECLAIGPAELAWVCAFYTRIGNDLAQGPHYQRASVNQPD